MAIVRAHLPARHVRVVAADDLEAAAGRPQHAEVWNCPVRSVEHEQILAAVAIEVCDVELVVRLELPPEHRVVVAGDQPQPVRAVIREETQVLHDPVDPVEDRDLVLAITIEVADVEPVVRHELPRARHPLDRTERHVQLRAVRAVDHD